MMSNTRATPADTFQEHAKRMIPHLETLLDLCKTQSTGAPPTGKGWEESLLDKLDERLSTFEELLKQKRAVDNAQPTADTAPAPAETPALKVHGTKTPIELLSEIIQGIVTEGSRKYQTSIALHYQEDPEQSIFWQKLFDEENVGKPVENFLRRDDLQSAVTKSHGSLNDAAKRGLVEQYAGVVVPEQLDGDLDHDWIELFRGDGSEQGQQTEAMTRMCSEEAFKEMKAAKERGKEVSRKKALRFAVDGRNDTDNWPHFLLKDAGYATQTAEIDIFCQLFIMLCEVKMSGKDAYCLDSLQQILNRLRVLVSMNCFIRKAFGFCANGDKAFLVVFERRLQDNKDDRREVIFKDSYTIFPINPLWITTIWNALVERAEVDLSEFFHPDAMVVAQAIKHTFDAEVLGFVRVSLEAQSSSRVYCVRPAHVGCFSGQRRCIHAELNGPPLFAVKVQSSATTRGAKEHDALRRIHFKLTTTTTTDAGQGQTPESIAEIDAFRRAFYVHSSLFFDPAKEEPEPDKVEFARRLDVYHQLKAIEQFVSKSDTDAESNSLFWWEQLGARATLKKHFPLGATAVVMDYGCSLKKFLSHMKFANNDAWDMEEAELSNILEAWLNFFHSAGVLHTDLRVDNVMLFQKRSLKSIAWCREVVDGFDEKMKVLLGVSTSLNEIFESVNISAEDTKKAKKQVSQQSNTRSNRSGNTATALSRDKPPQPAAPVLSTMENKLVTGWFPQPIDFDLAVCATDNESSVLVDIRGGGAQYMLVRRIMGRIPPEQTHVKWTAASDLKMATKFSSELNKLIIRTNK